MKKLLIGLLALVSISSFAQTKIIVLDSTITDPLDDLITREDISNHERDIMQVFEKDQDKMLLKAQLNKKDIESFSVICDGLPQTILDKGTSLEMSLRTCAYVAILKH